MKQFRINLPVKNVQRSNEFFTRPGFKFNEQFGNSPGSACLAPGEKNVTCMPFNESIFKQCINHEAGLSQNAAEVLLSIDTQSKEKEDEMVAKLIASGGTSNHRPAEIKSCIYGCVLIGLDGHPLNVLFMDIHNIPKS